MGISPKKVLITTNPEQFCVHFWYFTVFYAWNPMSLQTPQEGILFSKRDLWYKIHCCDPQRFFVFAFLKQKLFLIKKPCLMLWGSAVKDAGDVGSIPALGRSPGERNGNPLQYSCLGNLMDRGALLSTVYGVAKSQTQLSNSTTTAHWKDWKVEGLCLQVGAAALKWEVVGGHQLEDHTPTWFKKSCCLPGNQGGSGHKK